MRKHLKLLILSLLIFSSFALFAQAFRIEGGVSGYVVSVDPDKKEFILSVTCTQLDEWTPACAESNPKWYDLIQWLKNLFHNPRHVRVITDENTEYKSYDDHIESSFSGITPRTPLSVKGEFDEKAFWWFMERNVIAEEITVPGFRTWIGRLISIEKDSRDRHTKILNLKTSFDWDLKAYLTEGTSLLNEDGQEISLEDLSLGDDVLGVWGRYYEMKYKEGTKTVIGVDVIAEEIVLKRKAIEEGEQVPAGSYLPCEEGLVEIRVKKPEQYEGEKPRYDSYCTKCGDGVCKSPEDQEACPEDCAHISLEKGNSFDFRVIPDENSFDFDNNAFIGDLIMGVDRVVVLGDVNFVVADNTEIYEGNGSKNTYPYCHYRMPGDFDFSDLQEASGYNFYFGRLESVRIVGRVLDSNTVEADNIIRYVQ